MSSKKKNPSASTASEPSRSGEKSPNFPTPIRRPPSEAQLRANRLNAQKSTGPRTDEGKEQSRANSLKHGLAGAGVVSTREDDEEFERKLALYREHVGPGDELEDDLVRNMAMASTRLERCRRQDLAGVAKRKGRVLRKWKANREEELRALFLRLGEEPAVVIGQLERMTRGCECLAGQWAQLEDKLQRDGCWAVEEYENALLMLGRRVRGHHEGDKVVQTLLGRHKALQPGAGDEASRAEALAALLAFVAEHRERLEKLRIAAWMGIEGLTLAEELDAVQVDTSGEGMRLLRYASAADCALHRNLGRLIKIRLGEPEHLSVKKWVKMGKQMTRIWNGLMWVPSPDKDGSCPTPGWSKPASEGEVRNEANSATEDPVVEAFPKHDDVEERIRAEIARACAPWPPPEKAAAKAPGTAPEVPPAPPEAAE